MLLFKQVFHSKDDLLESITTDILNCEQDPHRSFLNLNTSKPTKTTITCHHRLCSFRCEFTRKKNKDEWTSTKNNRVHKHLRDNGLELNKIKRPSDFNIAESSTTAPLPVVASPPLPVVASPPLSVVVPAPPPVLPTLANSRKSIIRASQDGYCGYHSVSLAVHRNQEHTMEVVQKILATLQTNASRYSEMNFEVEKLRERVTGALNWTGKKALPPIYQFNGFECAQLVADTYERPVVIVQEDSTTFPTTFIPLLEPPTDPSNPDRSPIVFRYTILSNGMGHYDLFKLEERCMFPAINTMYNKIGMDIAQRVSTLLQVCPIAEPVVAPPIVIELLDD